MAKLIVLEGPDGVGKTTTKGVIEQQLKVLGKTFKSLRHPGDTKTGTALREIFIDKSMNLCAQSRVHLIAANKIEMIRQSINGSDVDYIIVDRLDLSTVIYQSVMQMIEDGVMDDNRVVFDQMYQYIFNTLVNNIDHSEISEIHYILLDNDDDVLDARLRSRDCDSIESMGKRFHRLVRQKYRNQSFIKDFIYRYPMKTTVAYTTTNSMEDIKMDMELHLKTIT